MNRFTPPRVRYFKNILLGILDFSLNLPKSRLLFFLPIFRILGGHLAKLFKMSVEIRVRNSRYSRAVGDVILTHVFIWPVNWSHPIILLYKLILLIFEIILNHSPNLIQQAFSFWFIHNRRQTLKMDWSQHVLVFVFYLFLGAAVRFIYTLSWMVLLNQTWSVRKKHLFIIVWLT